MDDCKVVLLYQEEVETSCLSKGLGKFQLEDATEAWERRLLEMTSWSSRRWRQQANDGGSAVLGRSSQQCLDDSVNLSVHLFLSVSQALRAELTVRPSRQDGTLLLLKCTTTGLAIASAPPKAFPSSHPTLSVVCTRRG